MSKQMEDKILLRLKRKMRIRRNISGTATRPRLTVYRSARHISAQVIDDSSGRTIASVSSFSADRRAGIDFCTELGKRLAEACIGSKIQAVVFDKNGYEYHGRVKAFADGARSGGLAF